MQKVTKFLEAYVQWIALSLGLLWMLWMGYSYWGSNPVAAEINGKHIAPGDVEEEIINSQPVDALDKAHQDLGPYPPNVQEKLRNRDRPKYVDLLTTQMAAGGGPAPVLAQPPFPGGDVVKTTPVNTSVEEAGGSTMPDITGVLALETNVVNDAFGIGISSGMSVVKRPDATVPVPAIPVGGQQIEVIQPPDVNLANLVNPSGGAGAVAGGAPAVAGQPPQPVAPAPIAVVPEEVTWVTCAATLDMKKLAAAFEKAKLPPAQAFTSILRVELVREEQDSGGQFGNQLVVKDLTNQFRPPLPANDAAAQADQVAYLQWAQQHVADIVQPPFYEVLRGQLWRSASMPDAADLNNAANQPVTFDPATVKPGEVTKLPPEQLELWRKWKAEQDANKPKPTPRSTPTPTPGTGGGRNRGGFFAPVTAADSRIGGAALGRHAAPGALDRRRGPANAAENPIAQPTAQPTMLPNGQAQVLPTAPFSPAQQPTDLEVWAHDETTVPGKTYRYKLRIVIKNPLWATQNMAKNVADTSVWALTAETEWSKPIPSPMKRDFFVTTGGSSVGGVPKIGVDYFKWEDGVWKKNYVTLQPGDRVGETAWTVVDLRPTGNSAQDNRVLLVSDTGDAINRFYKTDKNSERYKKLLALVSAPVPPPGSSLQPGVPTPPTVSTVRPGVGNN